MNVKAEVSKILQWQKWSKTNSITYTRHSTRAFFTTDFIARLKTSNHSTMQDLISYSYRERVKRQKMNNSVTVSVLQSQLLLNSNLQSRIHQRVKISMEMFAIDLGSLNG